MYNPANKHQMMVVYDGIENSVFSSVVLQPLLKQLEQERDKEITLVSFEAHKIPNQELIRIIPAHDRLHVIIFKKIPFIGKTSLCLLSLNIAWLLGKIPCHHIVARGPLAGWIVLRALKKRKAMMCCGLCNGASLRQLTVTIQARGLCAEEYRYAGAQTKCIPGIKQIIQCISYKILRGIEQDAYGTLLNVPTPVVIEAVSPALKEYLIKTFQAQESCITIANNDLPAPPPAHLVVQWRERTRKKLEIPSDAYVYCYSGSYKPWQCADQTITFFAQQYKKNQNKFLLVLSTDQEKFKSVLHGFEIPETSFVVLSVDPKNLFEYLSAADAGLLFREHDIINWVSRPTKMLEYQAVGLKIIHNNTVALLVDQEDQLSFSQSFKNSSKEIC